QQSFFEKDALMCGYCTPAILDERDGVVEKKSAPERRRRETRLRREHLPLRHASARHPGRAESRRRRNCKQNGGHSLCLTGRPKPNTSATKRCGLTRPRS